MFDIQAVIGWLLAQPAYIQVGASLVFFILVAPVILAAIAIAAERFEGIVAVAVVRYVPLASGYDLKDRTGKVEAISPQVR